MGGLCQWRQSAINGMCICWRCCLILPHLLDSRKARLFRNNIQYAHSYVCVCLCASLFINHHLLVQQCSHYRFCEELSGEMCSLSNSLEGSSWWSHIRKGAGQVESCTVVLLMHSSVLFPFTSAKPSC